MSIPIVVSGGAGNIKHIVELGKESRISAIALASVLHYGVNTIYDIKSAMVQNGIDVRI